MTSQQQTLARRGIIVAATLWLAIAGWLQFGMSDGSRSNRYSSYQTRQQNCSGSFSQRYDCRSSLTISRGRNDFYKWSRKLAIVFMPPLIVGIGWSRYRRRLEKAEEAGRRARARSRMQAHGRAAADTKAAHRKKPAAGPRTGKAGAAQSGKPAAGQVRPAGQARANKRAAPPKPA